MKVHSFKPCPLPSPHICSPHFIRQIFLDERILLPLTPPSPHNPSPPSYLPFLPLPLLRWTILYTHIQKHTESANTCTHVQTHGCLHTQKWCTDRTFFLGWRAGMPDHVHSHTYQRSPQDGGHVTPASYALTKTREPTYVAEQSGQN